MGTRIAIVAADPAFHQRLRARFGLGPAAGGLELPRGLAFCGADYRVYPFMRIADAVRFFSAMHDNWDPEQLAADFALAGLSGTFEVRRMKRTYQRALVLALAAAALPATLVIENLEEFDEPPAAALAARAIVRAPAALATFGGEARPSPALAATFTEVVAAGAFELEAPS